MGWVGFIGLDSIGLGWLVRLIGVVLDWVDWIGLGWVGWVGWIGCLGLFWVGWVGWLGWVGWVGWIGLGRLGWGCFGLGWLGWLVGVGWVGWVGVVLGWVGSVAPLKAASLTPRANIPLFKPAIRQKLPPLQQRAEGTPNHRAAPRTSRGSGAPPHRGLWGGPTFPGGRSRRSASPRPIPAHTAQAALRAGPDRPHRTSALTQIIEGPLNGAASWGRLMGPLNGARNASEAQSGAEPFAADPFHS